MKITDVSITQARDGEFDYTSLFVHRAGKVSHYEGNTQHFFERACLLLNLFYAQGR